MKVWGPYYFPDKEDLDKDFCLYMVPHKIHIPNPNKDNEIINWFAENNITFCDEETYVIINDEQIAHLILRYSDEFKITIRTNYTI